MLNVVQNLQLVNSALSYLDSEHKMLDTYKSRYTALVEKTMADEDVSCETMQMLFTLRDYISELESCMTDLLNLFVEFGTGRAEHNAEAMNSIVTNNDNKDNI